MFLCALYMLLFTPDVQNSVEKALFKAHVQETWPHTLRVYASVEKQFFYVFDYKFGEKGQFFSPISL